MLEILHNEYIPCSFAIFISTHDEEFDVGRFDEPQKYASVGATLQEEWIVAG